MAGGQSSAMPSFVQSSYLAVLLLYQCIVLLTGITTKLHVSLQSRLHHDACWVSHVWKAEGHAFVVLQQMTCVERLQASHDRLRRVAFPHWV